MSEPDELGLPTEEESERLKAFENRFVNAVEFDEHSILAAVLTRGGEKEFVFYTPDVEGFMDRLRRMPQEQERYPITIHRYEDPNWLYFYAVIPMER